MARRYLAGRSGGFISVIAVFSFLGILLGVATLIVVLAVMNGFRKDLVSRILGFNGHITYFPDGLEAGEEEDLARRLQETAGVQAVFPMIQEQLLAGHAGRVFGIGLRAFAPEDLPQRSEIAASLTQDELAAFARGGLLLGERLAERYDLAAGDRITLFNPDGNRTVLGTLPAPRVV